MFHEATQATIGAPTDAVGFEFVNQTGAIVYLYRARLREKRKNFPVLQAAVRDLSSGWRPLTLRYPKEAAYTHMECILQTNERVMACIAIDRPMNAAFYNHRPGKFRKWFRVPKYYELEYTAMVGERKYTISTIY